MAFVLNERELTRFSFFAAAVCQAPHLKDAFINNLVKNGVEGECEKALYAVKTALRSSSSVREAADKLVMEGGCSRDVGICFLQCLSVNYDDKDVSL